ncbi:MAG: helix-turn-helix transcriptional regulator [Lawsonibacter sp.]|nr:helix-turn-helix transcriptional regulator [Lawsonibacter sp.]
MECKLKLKEIREARGMTQRRLAQELGVTPGAVAKWELGYHALSMDNLVNLADVLGCTTDAILGRAGPEQTSA